MEDVDWANRGSDEPSIAHFWVGSAACSTRSMAFGFQVTWSLSFC
jgi:hypothetical protein